MYFHETYETHVSSSLRNTIFSNASHCFKKVTWSNSASLSKSCERFAVGLKFPSTLAVVGFPMVGWIVKCEEECRLCCTFWVIHWTFDLSFLHSVFCERERARERCTMAVVIHLRQQMASFRHHFSTPCKTSPGLTVSYLKRKIPHNNFRHVFHFKHSM